MAILLVGSEQLDKVFNRPDVEVFLQSYHYVRIDETSLTIETDETPFSIHEKLKKFIGYDESLVVMYLCTQSISSLN